MAPNSSKLSSDFLEIQNKINTVLSKAAISLSKDVICFYGNSKSGKTTFACAISGFPLIAKVDRKKRSSIAQPANFDGPTIGVGGQSETEEPEIFGQYEDTLYYMLDMPGRSDNKGFLQDIANAFFNEKVLCAAGRVKFVFCAPFNLVDSRNPYPLYEALYDLYSICPLVKDNLCILVTQSRGYAAEYLEDAMKMAFLQQSANEEVISIAKETIGNTLRNGLCVEFLVPEASHGISEAPYHLPEETRRSFRAAMDKLEGVHVEPFSLSLSHEAKEHLGRMHGIFYQQMLSKTKELVASFKAYYEGQVGDVQNARDSQGKPMANSSKIAHYQLLKLEIDEILEVCQCTNGFLAVARDRKAEVPADYLDEMERFLFVENVKDKYEIMVEDQRVDIKGDREFFLMIKKCLLENVILLNSLIESLKVAEAQHVEAAREAAQKLADVEAQRAKAAREAAADKDELDKLKAAQKSADDNRSDELHDVNKKLGKVQTKNAMWLNVLGVAIQVGVLVAGHIIKRRCVIS